MFKAFTFSLIFLFIVSCSTESPSNNESDIRLKEISFSEAVNNELLPLQLSFSIPENFVVKSSNNLTMGTLWGIDAEIEDVIKTQITKTKTGFFRIFVSVNTAYDAQSKKFTGEDEMEKGLAGVGAKNIKIKKKFIGGYPGLVTSADLNGKKMFSCFIATLNSTNVITILYYSPSELTGNENKLWEKVIGSIKRLEYKKETISGKDAKSLLKKVLESNQFKKFRVELLTKLDVEKALEVPQIQQSFEADHSISFFGASYSWQSSNILRVGNHTTSFSQPWTIPKMSMQINKSGNKINVKSTVNGKALPERTENVDVFAIADSSPIQYLTGYPFFSMKPSDKIIEAILELFDLKVTDENSEVLVLEGTPSKKAFLAYIKDNNMPEEFNGVPFVNELMKRFAKISVIIDARSKRLKSILVSGKLNEYPVSTQIKILEIN